ncbi:DNA alkylation repair protein [uncultured Anaerotruncus sp.]|uniref:DNA alkylation repair protein n=1 Tax=uncultured Anaerotruncus sp. TaxID=905011 RepID=UPI00280AF027|nr:DNA alkylation repair protein [uncultured Anaerotruncus sp.]
MTGEEYAALQARLRAMADPDYRAFHQKLVPEVDNLLGVRIPALRGLARELARGDWRGYLAAAGTDAYEETMLQGLVLGYARMEIGELLERLREFIPKIGNWAVNDSVCAGLKLVKKHREETLAFLRPYFAGEAEFEVRFAVVMLMDHYIDEAYIDEALSLLRTVRHEGYYVKMAVAWALSVCYVKFPERTRPLLQGEAFDPQTRRMALQKIVESNRVDAREKAEIRALRKAVR